MMMTTSKWAVVVATVMTVACGSKEYSFDTVEDARRQAKDNGIQNAQKFRADNKLPDCEIYPRGDSTITNTCPNGDGWASNELRCPNKTIKLKCSTVSDALGCMTEEDFKSRAYAEEDGKCQPLTKVPHPLPKLAK